MSDKKIIIWPPRMSGQATIGESRLPAETVENMYWWHGFDEVTRCWDDLDRADVLLCCWYVGKHGTRREKKLFGEWAELAFSYLWHWNELGACPDPPRKPE